MHREKKADAKEARQWYTEYWKDIAAKEWSDNLHKMIKLKQPPPPGAYVGALCETSARLT